MDQKLQVKDVMTRDVISTEPDEAINIVADKLTKNRIHGVPVMEKGRIAGIITETDFFTKSFPGLYLPAYIDFLKNAEFVDSGDSEHKKKVKELVNSKARDIMTSPCITVPPEMDISEFIDLVKLKQLTTVPVEDKNKNLVGIITTADIIKLI